MIKELFEVGKDFADKMQKKNIDTYAGSTSFFLMLSLIPLLILLCSLLPYTSVTDEDLIQVVTELTPGFANGILIQLVEEVYSKGFSIISITVLLTIWAGALGMLAIIRGLNSIYEVPESRNFLVLRGIAILYTMTMIVIMLIMLIAMVFGKVVKGFIIATVPTLEQPIMFLSGFKYLIVIGGATILFTLMYTYVPSVKLRYLHQLPGGLFSAVGWYMFSWFFAIYVNHTNRYSTLYGSLSTPIVMMFWLYFCIYIFFIGAFINYFLNSNKVFG